MMRDRRATNQPINQSINQPFVNVVYIQHSNPLTARTFICLPWPHEDYAEMEGNSTMKIMDNRLLGIGRYQMMLRNDAS